MPAYLHQVIAVERGVEADSKRSIAEIQRVLSVGGDGDPLTGLNRTHRPRGEDDPQLPAETRKVQFTVADLLASAQKALTRLYDLKLTREAGNAAARADVIVDGEVLLADVPLGYLLFLEGRIAELISGLADKLPVLDPAEDWHDSRTDASLPRGVWASAPRETTSKTRKVQVQVLYDATPEHPAQVRPYETDLVTGYWTLIKFSGQLPARTVQEIRERAVKVLEAVRSARELANTLEVANREAGQVILGHIFGDAVTSS